MVYEEFILIVILSVVVGIIVGWFGKEWKYKRKNLALKDEKVLNEKISIYRDVFKITCEILDDINDCINHLTAKSYTNKDKDIKEINDNMGKVTNKIKRARAKLLILSSHAYKDTSIPHWMEHYETDLGIALVELFSYVADRLSYYQDAVANGAYLDTARQRSSVKNIKS